MGQGLHKIQKEKTSQNRPSQGGSRITPRSGRRKKPQCKGRAAPGGEHSGQHRRQQKNSALAEQPGVLGDADGGHSLSLLVVVFFTSVVHREEKDRREMGRRIFPPRLLLTFPCVHATIN